MFQAACIALVLVGCGKSDPPVAFESCDNGVDDDGDGMVDANDPDCAEPAPTGDTGTLTLPSTTTVSTGVTSAGSPLGLLIDPSYDFLYEAGLTACPQKIGRVVASNATAEDAHLVMSSDVASSGTQLIEFDIIGAGVTARFVDATVPAGTDSTVDVYYNCAGSEDFSEWFHVVFDNSAESNGADVFLYGLLQ